MKIQFDLPKEFSFKGINVTIDKAWFESDAVALFLQKPVMKQGRQIGTITGVTMNYERGCVILTAHIDDGEIEF